MSKKYDKEFNRDEYIKIAKDLRYPKDVIEKLKQAEDDNACSRIMHDARKDVI